MQKLAIIGAILLFSAAGFALYQQSSSATVTTIDAVAFTSPTNPSQGEIAAFSEAIAKNETLPAGWTITGNEGKVRVVDTGLIVPTTAERSWTVTVIDEQSDLASATVYVNGQAIYTATRANGGIVDRGVMSIATLPVLVPPAGQSWAGKVDWTGNDGVIRVVENLTSS